MLLNAKKINDRQRFDALFETEFYRGNAGVLFFAFMLRTGAVYDTSLDSEY